MKGLTIHVEPNEEDINRNHYRVTEFDGGLAELQAAVGGFIEPVPSDPLVTIWVNEEGKFHNPIVNRLAMDVWIPWDIHHCMVQGGDWIAGNVVVTGGVDGRGETLDIDEHVRGWVLRVARDAGADTGEVRG